MYCVVKEGMCTSLLGCLQPHFLAFQHERISTATECYYLVSVGFLSSAVFLRNAHWRLWCIAVNSLYCCLQIYEYTIMLVFMWVVHYECAGLSYRFKLCKNCSSEAYGEMMRGVGH